MSAYKIFTRQINFNIKFLAKHSDGDNDDDDDDAEAPENQTPAGKPAAKRKAPKQTLKTKKKKQ